MSHIALITPTDRVSPNPGDMFIGIGAQYLIEQALGPQRWMLVDVFSKRRFRQSESALRDAKFAVYAGMPQYANYDYWCEWRDDLMWRDCLIPWNIPVLSLSGGAAHGKATIDGDAFVADCMASAKTRRIISQRFRQIRLCAVRDPFTSGLLTKLGHQHAVLPCSAAWSSSMWGVQPESTRPHLFLVPPRLAVAYRAPIGRALALAATNPGMALRRMRSRLELNRDYTSLPETWVEIYRALAERHSSVKVLCHTRMDQLALVEHIPNDDLWYHSDPYTLLRQYGSAHTVVSARIHGSLPAFGIPDTRVLNISVDVRGATIELVPQIANIPVGELSVERVLREMETLEPSSSRDLVEPLEAYRKLIATAVGSL
ncbi:MAG: hypothetical protein O3A46_01565 [Candidatus Poribacteria bacterium]|nr:hypothetical protein [Candidatus Poribacteria bacterium]